jgi:hypothetical protein
MVKDTSSQRFTFPLAVLAIGLVTQSACLAQAAFDPCPDLPKVTPNTQGDPHPQPRPSPTSLVLSKEGDVTVAKMVTGTGCFPESDPFTNPPGTNFLPNVDTNAFDGKGNEMPNTLPSTASSPYNLQDGQPVVSKINPVSPTDDLLRIFDQILGKPPKTDPVVAADLKLGVDILEGNPIAGRIYSGFPLLHFKASEEVKRVVPIKDSSGHVIGGNVNVHQIWYDTHIESDTAFLDPTDVWDVPWTITYTVDVLSRGNDDFSPAVMYFDDPELTKPQPPLPHIGMDQTFFNMEEGTRTVFKIKMAPGKYYNLVYTWGWRAHPPRVQVIENATKHIPPKFDPQGKPNPQSKTLVQWEIDAFGPNPSAHKEYAIAQIGDLSPAKRMWAAFRDAQNALRKHDRATVIARVLEARDAFGDWRDRARLPKGVQLDSSSDLTLFYVNNTIYGQFTAGYRGEYPPWQLRGTTLKVTLLNGDYFEHGYQNVDFGGSRGWENQFKSTVALDGSGCWFTFGRFHWWMNVPSKYKDEDFMIKIPPASRNSAVPGEYKIELTYSYEPSRRLRFYQFDPLHHDVAIFSIH